MAVKPTGVVVKAYDLQARDNLLDSMPCSARYTKATAAEPTLPVTMRPAPKTITRPTDRGTVAAATHAHSSSCVESTVHALLQLCQPDLGWGWDVAAFGVGMGWDGIGWGWDGMALGGDGMGWDWVEMGWDGIGCGWDGMEFGNLHLQT